jgi:hypothetical protein
VYLGCECAAARFLSAAPFALARRPARFFLHDLSEILGGPEPVTPGPDQLRSLDSSVRNPGLQGLPGDFRSLGNLECAVNFWAHGALFNTDLHTCQLNSTAVSFADSKRQSMIHRILNPERRQCLYIP